MNDQQLLRYSRHILLDEIGLTGQEKLFNATVLVVGCGGLGTAALPYLAAAGVGHLILADPDLIDESNLQRQILFTEQDIGQNKAETTAKHLRQRNHACRFTIETRRLTESDLCQYLPECDVVLDCSDHFPTRQAINAAAFATKTPLVSGAAVGFSGQLAVYHHSDEQPCYRCLFDDVGDVRDGACALFGVFSPLVGIIGTAQAAEVLKIIMDLPVETGVLHTYHALEGKWKHFRMVKNPSCGVCGKRD